MIDGKPKTLITGGSNGMCFNAALALTADDWNVFIASSGEQH